MTFLSIVFTAKKLKIAGIGLKIKHSFDSQTTPTNIRVTQHHD